MFSLLVSQLELKSEMTSLTLTQETSHKEQEGMQKMTAALNFAEVLWW
jgi:hypothetical protein